jgi:CDP-6-deoxy-D-xylo-4-hexulose-3-dehydrase
MIFAVNLLGNPNDFDKINSMIAGKNIILLEDNCESLGAAFNGKQAGTIGLMGTYSGFFSHHISKMEGGMIVTDDEELYQILLSTRAHGWTRNLPKDNLITTPKSDNPFDELYRFVLPGFNFRPLEIMGAIGSEQMKKFPEFLAKRRENAAFFTAAFKDNPYFYTQQEIASSSWFGFSLIIKPDCKKTREEIAALLIKNEIEVRPIVAGNFTKNEVLKYFDYTIHGRMKNAEYLDKNGFFVGNHHYDIKDKISYLKETLDGLNG